MIDNMPITLSQMYVGTEDRKFRHKAGGCSEVFNLVTENLSRSSPCYWKPFEDFTMLL